MKKTALLLAILIGTVPCFAKRKPKTDYYDRVGTVTYHIGPVRNHLDGRDDWYEIGDYTCAGGDEHHAPTCLKTEEWLFRDELSIDIALEDGTKIAITNSACASDADRHGKNMDLCNLMEALDRRSRLRMDSLLPNDGDVAQFRYRLVDGQVFIEVHDMLEPRIISHKIAKPVS